MEARLVYYDPGTLSKTPGREGVLLEPAWDETPLIFPNQLRLLDFAAALFTERGLFVISERPPSLPMVCRLPGDGAPFVARFGVNPVWTVCNALRRRGVEFSWSCRLSAYNACTGTLTSSNSSGRARFLPTETSPDATGIVSTAAIGGVANAGARFSGVRALKTVGGGGLRSGVLGLETDAGPETTRFAALERANVYLASA